MCIRDRPDDIRPGTKKGKLDRKPIWLVTIKMPKKLIADIYTGYRDESVMDPLNIPPTPPPVAQPAEEAATETMDEIETA